MKGARFDEHFLSARAKKQSEWKRKGVNAGHGGQFDSKFGLGTKFDSTVFARHFDSAIDTSLIDSLPNWLSEIIKKDAEIKAALAGGGGPPSLHKKALVAVAKDPTLYFGVKATQGVKAKKANKEHYIQVALFYMLESEYPEIYPFAKAIPNGGVRATKTAIDLNAEGQKKGSLDIDVDYPKGKYHGLKLEVKAELGSASNHQLENVERLLRVGYMAQIKKGFEPCWTALKTYLDLPDFDNSTTIK